MRKALILLALTGTAASAMAQGGKPAASMAAPDESNKVHQCIGYQMTRPADQAEHPGEVWMGMDGVWRIDNWDTVKALQGLPDTPANASTRCVAQHLLAARATLRTSPHPSTECPADAEVKQREFLNSPPIAGCVQDANR